MRAFWAKGYEATSLSDLMEATGLHKGSLYQAFGDKHALFIESLKRYLADMGRQKSEALKEAATPLDGLRDVAHRMIEIADDDCGCPMGCMAINTVVELEPHDAEVKHVLGQHIEFMRQSLKETVEQAQAAGQINSERPAELVTALLMTFMAGISTNLKGVLTKAQAHELLDAQLAALT